MIRLLGAITGSALAAAALLVLIGVPQFRAQPNDVERSVVTLPYSTQPVEDELDYQPSASASVAESSAVEMPTEPAEAHSSTPETIPIADTTSAAAADPSPVLDDEADWYAFWSPFRSELAASGFIEQLQTVTGLDYRVLKVKPGVYEVAFAYVDETDINGYLSQITAATGLNMSER